MSTGFDITQYQNFDLSNGTLGSASGITGAITDAGNGWYRCVTVANSTTGATSQRAVIYCGTASYVQNGTGNILVWGAQVEAGAFPTSYIRTAGTTATRAADSVTIVGTNFSIWYNVNEGTFLWAGDSYDTQYSAQPAIRVTQGTNARGIGIQFDSRTGTDDAQFQTRNNIAQTVIPSAVPYVIGNNMRIVGAFDSNDVSASFNGSGTVTGSPSYTYGTENAMQIMGGNIISGTNAQFNGHTRRLTYWPVRLNDATLQKLSRK
jgi:hypothetical protein